jgi:hypothetical protein
MSSHVDLKQSWYYHRYLVQPDIVVLHFYIITDSKSWHKAMCNIVTECKTLAFKYEPHWMLRAALSFGKYCSCHLQGEYKTLDNLQYSTWLIPESRRFTLNASRVNLRSVITAVFPFPLSVKVSFVNPPSWSTQQ